MSFAGKTVVVTGAASGIGAETARILKSKGATVVAVDRNEPEGNYDQFIKADLSTLEAVSQLAEQIPSGIDGLCNVAGVPPTAPPEMVLKVNFLALRELTERLIPKMNDNASIVNVASLAGLGWPENGDKIREFMPVRDFDQAKPFFYDRLEDGDPARSYFFAKECLVVWTMMNRWTWRDRGIRMNTVSPGPVTTPIFKDFLETLGARIEKDTEIMDRNATPEDIAPAIVFLASEDSVWLRGINLPTDGGMQSHLWCEKYGHLEG